MKTRVLVFKNIVIITLSILLALIIFTLYLINLINSGIISGLTDNTIQTIMLLFLVVISGVTISGIIYYLYKQEINKRQTLLDELISYVGVINVQLSQFKSSFDELKKTPRNKKELKYVINLLIIKVLGIVDCDWVIFRAVELKSIKTVIDYTQVRGKLPISQHKISNKNLVENKSPQEYTVIYSNLTDCNIRFFCIIPHKTIDKIQHMMIEKIMNDLCLLYLYYISVVKHV